jgi:cyanate permease
MASVLYEPAFTVLAKRCAPRHQRAITIVTLAAGLASTIFQPVTSLLTTQYGWRTALVVLAAVLAAVTVPVHLAVLGGGPTPAAGRPGRGRPPEADRRFWTLTAAFAAVSVTSFGTSVLLVAYLVDHGWSLGRASLAGGTLGAMQLPGRLAFGPMTRRMSRGTLVGTMFALPAVGVVTLVASGGTAAVWVAVVVLGVSQGATTLLRATLFVDLYGTARIGALNGLASTRITVARALAPFATSLVVAAGGYPVAFLLLASSSAAAAVVAGRALRHDARPGAPRSSPAEAAG